MLCPQWVTIQKIYGAVRLLRWDLFTFVSTWLIRGWQSQHHVGILLKHCCVSPELSQWTKKQDLNWFGSLYGPEAIAVTRTHSACYV